MDGLNAMRKMIFTLFLAPLFFCSAPCLADTPAPAKVSDPQIAAIVLVANRVDVEAGKFALQHSSNAEVKKFAQLMVTDHEATIKLVEELATKLKLTPDFNDTSRSLEKGGEDNLKALSSLKGKQFDSAYIEHEVAYHQAVLDAIDKVLLPNASNTELISLIKKVRPVIAAHLEHAKMIAKAK